MSTYNLARRRGLVHSLARAHPSRSHLPLPANARTRPPSTAAVRFARRKKKWRSSAAPPQFTAAEPIRKELGDSPRQAGCPRGRERHESTAQSRRNKATMETI
jgi:hypothetical protein